MSRAQKHDHRGFSLIELLLALAILGVVSYFAVSLTNSIRHGNDASTTQQRMEIIVAKMKDYYRQQGSLVTVPGDNEIPVEELNLEQKYRFDGWGQPIVYNATANINGTTVDGASHMAGYLLSFGGDQERDVGAGTDVDSSGDDILMPINVNQEAAAIAMEELQVLQEKVNAFDRAYAGVDNNGTGTVDGIGCVAATGAGGGCPPTNGLGNDPNCGTATLDAIESTTGANNDRYGCISNSALQVVINYYGLSNSTYYNDPWGSPYQWDDSIGSVNPRYHKFFSMGQNGTADDGDDIIP